MAVPEAREGVAVDRQDVVDLRRVDVHNLSYSLAAEYAPQRIRVNAIAPSLAETSMKDFILGQDPKGQIEQALLATIPLGRLAVGADIAAAAVFLASEEASFITGVVLPVDGGRMVA